MFFMIKILDKNFILGDIEETCIITPLSSFALVLVGW
jgi:hypothetical protein